MGEFIPPITREGRYHHVVTPRFSRLSSKRRRTAGFDATEVAVKSLATRQHEVGTIDGVTIASIDLKGPSRGNVAEYLSHERVPTGLSVRAIKTQSRGWFRRPLWKIEIGEVVLPDIHRKREKPTFKVLHTLVDKLALNGMTARSKGAEYLQEHPSLLLARDVIFDSTDPRRYIRRLAKPEPVRVTVGRR